MPSKWPKSITIIRHGESERNVAKAAALASGAHVSYVGAVRDQDTCLTAKGKIQATCVGREMEARPEMSTLFVSPYLRTRQTADHMLNAMSYSPKIVIEERVREMEFGLLDGLTREGFEVKYPEEAARRIKEGKYWYRPPGGESRPDVCERVRSFLSTLTRDYEGERVGVICHSVVVLIFRRLFERWNEDQYMIVDREDDVKNCSITVYEPNERGSIRLEEYNTVVYPELS
jgi:broad specificity phosphatase PhoE